MGSTARAATKKLLANVFIIGTHLICNRSVRMNFDNPVGNGLNEFMVVRSEKDAPLEGNQSLVDCRNGLKIQMVRRLVEHQHVRSKQHHA